MKASILGVLACASLATLQVAAQENYTQWAQSANITINTSSTGLKVSGNVRKFPFLVRLDSTFNFTQSVGRGVDVRFAKADGTHLKYQRENWDSAGKKAEFWVLIDTVYGNNATQSFKMHWGKAAADDSSNGKAVFDTANGFAGVWHLGGTTYLNDATANANTAQITTGTNHNTEGPTDAAGVVGRGRQFTEELSGTVIRKLSVPGSPSLDITGTSITVSAWINSGEWGPENDGQTTGNRRILCKGNSDNTTAYILAETTDQDFVQFGLGSGVETPLADEYYIPLASWRLIHAMYDGTKANIYVDGILRASTDGFGEAITGTGSTTLNGNGLHIGGRGNTTVRDQFIGLMDEVRVQKVGRDSNWVRLEYMNQKQPAFNPIPTSIRSVFRTAPVANSFSVKASGRGLVFGFAAGSPSVRMSIVDIQGRTLWTQTSQAGNAALTWDGVTTGGVQASPGLYIVRMLAEGQTASVQRTVTYAP